MIGGSGSIPPTNGSGPGGPKTCGSGGSGSGTLPTGIQKFHSALPSTLDLDGR
jgi:hypothetical protein